MMKRSLFFLGMIVLALAVFAVAAKNAIAKMAIEKGVRFATGLTLKMKSFDFSLTKSYVRIKGLQLYHPQGFQDRVMADLPEVNVDYELLALLKKQIHLEELHLHLKEFVVIKNERGGINLDALKPVQVQGGPAEPSAPAKTEPAIPSIMFLSEDRDSPRKGAKKISPARTKKWKGPEVQIDNLYLQIERVVYKDYSGPTPTVRQFNVNINERYEDIQNLNYVISLIVVKVMMQTPIALLPDLDVSALQADAADALASSRRLASKTASEALVAAQKARGYLEQADYEAARRTIQDITEEITGDLKEVAGIFKKNLRRSLSQGEEK